MPYAVIEDKVAKISPQYRGELLAFLDFLIFKQGESVSERVSHDAASSRSRRKKAGRTLGGFEEGFYMSPDFDAPLECFKEYM